MRERSERQTTTKFNDEDEEATLETQMGSVRRQMERRGYFSSTLHGMTVFRFPKERVRIRAGRSLELLQEIKQGAYDIPEEVRFSGLHKFERETIINFNAFEKEAWVATRHKGIVNLMRRLGVRLYSDQGGYLCFLIPKVWVRIRKELSTEEKELERLRGQERYMARKSKSIQQEQIKYAVSPQKPIAVEGQMEKKRNIKVK